MSEVKLPDVIAELRDVASDETFTDKPIRLVAAYCADAFAIVDARFAALERPAPPLDLATVARMTTFGEFMQYVNRERERIGLDFVCDTIGLATIYAQFRDVQ